MLARSIEILSELVNKRPVGRITTEIMAFSEEVQVMVDMLRQAELVVDGTVFPNWIAAGLGMCCREGNYTPGSYDGFPGVQYGCNVNFKRTISSYEFT